MGGKCDNKKGDLNWEHPFPRIWEYKRGSDIKEGDIMEFIIKEGVVKNEHQKQHVLWSP